MKTKLNHLLLLGMAAVVATTAVSSCQKDPSVDDSIPAAPFTLSATEIRCPESEKVFPWTISKDGATDSVEESLDQMYVTSVNKLTLVASSPVSVVSTDPKTVSVEKLTDKEFILRYEADGEASIQVFNGASSFKKATNKTEFKVSAEKVIKPKQLVFTYDGVEKSFGFYSYKDWENYKGMVAQYDHQHINYAITIPFSNEKIYSPSEPPKVVHEIKLIGVRPENTSFRQAYFDPESVLKAIRERRALWKEGDIDTWDVWCEKNGYDITSWLTRYGGDVEGIERTFYFGICWGMKISNLCEVSLSLAGEKMYSGISVWYDNG